MLHNNNEIVGGTNIANEFANYFQSVYNIAETSKYNIDEITHNYTKMPNDTLNITNITIEEVHDSMKLLKLKKSTGPDDIPPFIINLNVKELYPCFVAFI